VVTLNFQLRSDILDAICAVGGPLDGAILHVFPVAAIFTPGTRLVRAEVLAAAATFTGSAAKTPIVWGSSYRDGNDNFYKDGGLLEWIATAAPAAPETIYSIAWDDGVNISIDPLPQPVTVEKIGDPVRYLMSMAYGQ